MSNWKEYKFSELCDISRGASPRPIHEYITDGEGMPWVKIADATKSNSRFIEDTAERIKLSGVKKSVEVFEGDLILSNSATPGLPKFMAINACIHDGWMLLRNFKNITKEFAYWLLLNERNNLVKQGTGTVFINLKTDILRNHIVKIPSIEEQNKIVSILNGIEDKIHLNTQINQTLEQIAQALFKSWFVDFDPVRAKVQALSNGMSLEQAELATMQAISGKTPEELTALSQTQPERYAELAETAKAFPCEMVEVDGVEVPKGWEVKALDEVANYQNGLALQKFRPENDEPFLPVVKIAQLRQGYADSDEKAKANIKPECIIDNGDVVFSWSGSLLVDIWCGGKAALNQHLFKVSSKEYPKWFYYFYTKHHLTEFQRIAYDKAVTMGHIKREHLSAAKCIVPNDELLANKTLENILGKIIFNRLENFNLQNTRDLLLPRLLNGEIQL